uniref:Uncharacterized protein n=1 Tax=Oryza nivara TaxID=4536 RepID=A0A0E0GEL4_ORYNI
MATRRVSGAARPAGYSVLSACRRHRQPEIASLPLVGDAGHRWHSYLLPRRPCLAGRNLYPTTSLPGDTLDRTSSPCRSRPFLRNIVDFRSPSSKLLSSTHIVLLLEENAGRSATTRCLQGIISSSCVPNHRAGVAVDTAEPPKSIDGEALLANASPHHHPLPAGEGHCQVAKVLVADIRKSLIYHPQVAMGIVGPLLPAPVMMRPCWARMSH